MAKINLLDRDVYNLISAGEVVERPASVVKELVENSIDAGAKNITIEIKNGGIKLIEVVDDGCGIEEDDVKSAFLPHATSKIKNASDLDTIFTLGFRGEALASIAAVAKVTLVSKTSDSDVGTSIYVEGGKFGEVKKVSSKVGTTITVEDVFFCVPARAKFLKKPKTEEQEITNIITRTILAHPEIKITYIVDGKKQLASVGTNAKDAMFSVYGKESVAETLEIHAEKGDVKVSGFVGRPTYSKSNRTYQTLIINGRYVVNLTVQTAVANAYGDFLMKRQYPFFIIYLSVPHDEIDVNVHPNKLDVKFLNSNQVYSAVFEAVSRALTSMDYIKEIDTETNATLSFMSKVLNNAPTEKIDKAGVNLNPFSGNFQNLSTEEKDKLEDAVFDSIFKTANQDYDKASDGFGLGSRLLERIKQKVDKGDKDAFMPENYKNSTQLKEEGLYDENAEPVKLPEPKGGVDYTAINRENAESFQSILYEKPKAKQTDFAEDEIKIVGKFFNTYLAIEWGNNVYMIDQHAAHERLLYDKLKAEYETSEIAVQPILIPYVYTANAEDDQIIAANLEALRSVGFDIDEFGDRTYKISAVPVVVSDIDFNKFFGMFLAEKLNKTKITEADIIKDSLMQMACKSAIKGGDDLSKPEIMKLLKEMSAGGMVLFCPHGRPVVVRITKAEIEKWFKRIV